MRSRPTTGRPRDQGAQRRAASAPSRVMDRIVSSWCLNRTRLLARLPEPGDDRGDVPGWVMVTLMTAGLVLTLWAVAGPRLSGVFSDAMDRVVGGP